MTPLEAELVRQLADGTVVGFDQVMAAALYAPGVGFYAAGGGAGRRRDFLTSPEVGPLFGAVVARALDAWWLEAGRPDRFPVIDAGAGPGGLARSILAARPRCADALELILVEVAEARWAEHPEGATSRADLPAPGELGSGPVVVLANELLDNLPVVLVERGPDGWVEVGVTASGGALVEAPRPLDAARRGWCEAQVPDAPVGARFPVLAEAASWVAEALALTADGGRVVVIDYARPSAELARTPVDEWLRTYARHGRGSGPLSDLGAQDITCDVALDQLALVSPPSAVRSQAEWLRAHGIDELVAEGARRWEAGAAVGGLEALAGRSRTTEAAALLDPDGLGAFTVVEWAPASSD